MATNGVACCILNLPCCKPPGSRAGALARIIHKAVGEDRIGSVACFEAAEAILKSYDLVPAGVGQAIGMAYYPVIADAIAHKLAQDFSMTTEPAEPPTSSTPTST